MSTMLKLLPVLFLLAAMPCRAQEAKSASGGSLSHEQAVAALEAHRFVIEAKEFYLPSGESPVGSPDSYVSMEGSRAVIRLAPDLFPGSPLSHLNVEDAQAVLAAKKQKKNGDRLYQMRIDGDKNWLKNKLTITLYGGSDKCSVLIEHGTYEDNRVRFTGQIRPL